MGGWLLCYYVVGCLLFGIPLPFIMWYFEYEPIHLVFTEKLLSDSYCEGMLAKLLIKLITILLGIVFWTVFYKAVGTIIFIFTLISSYLHSYLRTLQINGIFSESDLYRHFVCLNVGHRQFRDEISVMVLVLALVVFSQCFLTECQLIPHFSYSHIFFSIFWCSWVSRVFIYNRINSKDKD